VEPAVKSEPQGPNLVLVLTRGDVVEWVLLSEHECRESKECTQTCIGAMRRPVVQRNLAQVDALTGWVGLVLIDLVAVMPLFAAFGDKIKEQIWSPLATFMLLPLQRVRRLFGSKHVPKHRKKRSTLQQ
jgi:hypothetical protein